MTAIGQTQVRSFAAVPDTVRPFLRLEGLGMFIVGLIAWERLGGDWLWLVPVLLLPDLSMIGYLAGPALGSVTYNLVHNWALGLALLGAGLAWGIPVAALAGAVVIAHVGMDRLAGYGLKHPGSFKDTHMQRA